MNNPFRNWIQAQPKDALKNVSAEYIWNAALEVAIDHLKMRAEALNKKGFGEERISEAVACGNIIRSLQSYRIEEDEDE